MAVEEGAVFLTQVSSANIWVYSYIYCIFSILKIYLRVMIWYYLEKHKHGY